MYQDVTYRIEGIAPLMMHSSQLADPLNDYTKALKKLSANRKKTEETYEEMAAIEWEGSLYLNEKQQPIIPGICIESCFITAARTQKLGKVAASAIISDGEWVLEYDGPKTLDGLRKDKRFWDVRSVRVQQSRIMRTRPIFPVWALTFTLSFLPDQLNRDQITEILAIGGQRCGLGDYRPRFGRFDLVI